MGSLHKFKMPAGTGRKPERSVSVVRSIVEQETSESKTGEERQLPFWKTLLSTFQAAFGVQSASNKERDFKQGKLSVFILAGLLFVTAFVLTLMLVVKLVLSS